MRLADQIRQYVVDKMIAPARAEGRSTVQVVAGDVHCALALKNRFPAVCSALDTDKFLALAQVRRISRSGPEQGSTVTWVFGLD